MTVWIFLFSVLLVLDCLILGLLVLIQLPKKEAGVGVAFGGGATDALFGAGSGTALTQLTKYTAIAFFVLVFLLSVLTAHAYRSTSTNFKKVVDRAPAVAPAPAAPAPASAPAAKSNGVPLLTIPTAPAPAAASNTPPAASNAPAAPKK